MEVVQLRLIIMESNWEHIKEKTYSLAQKLVR